MMAQNKDVHTKINRWFWVTILTGFGLPLVAFLLFHIARYFMGSITIRADDIIKATSSLTVAKAIQLGPLLIGIPALLTLVASPYIYMAHKGYQWMTGIANKTHEEEHMSKYFIVVKWSYAGSVIAWFTFYGLLIYEDAKHPGSGVGDCFLTPAPFVVPLFGALVGYLVGSFVAKIKQDGQIQRRDIDPIG